MRATILVGGVVQGVGFRPFVHRLATNNSLCGYVQNRGDAGVFISVRGRKQDVENFVLLLKERKPPLAHYDLFRVSFLPSEEEKEPLAYDPNLFSILESSEEERRISGSVIPPDVALCDVCASELRDEKDRRHDYFFITCTNCGPRFTSIERLPHDRMNTTMKEFEMCAVCLHEYRDPADRRFHAETVSCKECGPKVFLVDRGGREIESYFDDPVRRAGELIEEGAIVAVKGYGGFHLAASIFASSRPIDRLRRIKHRSSKPFAVMARDLDSVRSFAYVNEAEKDLLLSPARPIVLLKRKAENDSSAFDLVSPGLSSVGVMLPYSAMHLMLFDHMKESAIVLTSANSASEPMITENDSALHELGSVADYFLLHDRRIAFRCDDSVARVNDSFTILIRRSRGYVPLPIALLKNFRSSALGVGAEMMVTACVSTGNKAILSQHVGDIESIETYQYLRETLDHLMKLTNVAPSFVVSDLHPTMNTTALARKLALEMNAKVIQIQHHHAHVASLMAEHGLDEVVGVACDGMGYGADGKIWGGEVLACSLGSYKRMGHLKEQLMIGGDLATTYPLRMLAGILCDEPDFASFLHSLSTEFPGGVKEVESILALSLYAKEKMSKERSIKTSSAGRVLDAVAALLGVCYERTYEGEPAMKLESIAVRGSDVLKLEPGFEENGRVLDTTFLLRTLFEKRKDYSVADLANSAESYLARGLAEIALMASEETGYTTIGFTGGVAYNGHISSELRKAVETRRRRRFVTNSIVPAGDGGISLGQVYAASLANS